ncbi:putative Ubiquitin carboxyl-terminal hydrolase [Monocercomonoides exilis]|uniref:putative Ubiquitin carboxyl-terminal hydrolase n=1 Tax=Monocercomonoides exilis TaxID=2049356 RepID=UPI003559F20C|nr:putative Ubiquitin carboxyl-terminal hydrolase [Monocercomonoides exilis]|eukprot:MONOS_12317.1-p1 / transcript=MONOS_12317.1 / gene=MONOS_12317 / organism=Monocercomonoides_exilis_PA203 / gene_product=unspecified product / transcript_product=unspecified product / location=Mono_scaffold00675:8999-11478(+) / protein_length=678 / sequence_SO=supercontig / SO=protein_coding / is_pseudo=false
MSGMKRKELKQLKEIKKQEVEKTRKNVKMIIEEKVKKQKKAKENEKKKKKEIIMKKEKNISTFAQKMMKAAWELKKLENQMNERQTKSNALIRFILFRIDSPAASECGQEAGSLPSLSSVPLFQVYRRCPSQVPSSFSLFRALFALLCMLLSPFEETFDLLLFPSSSPSSSSSSAPGYSLVKRPDVSSTALIESYLDIARVLVSFSSNDSSSHSVSSSSSSSSFGHSSQQPNSVSTKTLPSNSESDEETLQQLFALLIVMIRSFSSSVLLLLLLSAFQTFLLLFFCAVADAADIIQPLSTSAFLNAIVTLPISSSFSSSYLPSNIARCDSRRKQTSSHLRSNSEVELIQSLFVVDEESRKAILSLIAALCSGNEANTEPVLHASSAGRRAVSRKRPGEAGKTITSRCLSEWQKSKETSTHPPDELEAKMAGMRLRSVTEEEKVQNSAEFVDAEQFLEVYLDQDRKQVVNGVHCDIHEFFMCLCGQAGDALGCSCSFELCPALSEGLHDEPACLQMRARAMAFRWLPCARCGSEKEEESGGIVGVDGVLRDLPNTLIILLRRFDYQPLTGNRVKINDKFEFPIEEDLDLEPLTWEAIQVREEKQSSLKRFSKADTTIMLEKIGRKENLKNLQVPHNGESKDKLRPESYSKYRLQGIINHSGTANAGHCISFEMEKDAPH